MGATDREHPHCSPNNNMTMKTFDEIASQKEGI
jgi:hypothetical protein